MVIVPNYLTSWQGTFKHIFWSPTPISIICRRIVIYIAASSYLSLPIFLSLFSLLSSLLSPLSSLLSLSLSPSPSPSPSLSLSLFLSLSRSLALSRSRSWLLSSYLCESWRMPHMGQKCTLSGTPDFTPFGEFMTLPIHGIYRLPSLGYVFGLMILVCLSGLVWQLYLGLILLLCWHNPYYRF